MTKKGPPHITPEYMELKEGIEKIVGYMTVPRGSNETDHWYKCRSIWGGQLQALLDNTTEAGQ